jgi:hypothetical protein
MYVVMAPAATAVEAADLTGCKLYQETPSFKKAVSALYEGLSSRGYVCVRLTPQQTANLVECQEAHKRVFNLPALEKLTLENRVADADVRGYFTLPAKEVYESALGSVGLQPAMQQVRTSAAAGCKAGGLFLEACISSCMHGPSHLQWPRSCIVLPGPHSETYAK